MLKLIGKRLLALIPVLLLMLLLVVFLNDLAPGDVATQLVGDNATPEQVAAARERLGLDEPALERFGSYVANLAQGDLGRSFLNGEPVLDIIVDALPVTLSIAIGALLLAVVVGVPVGVVAAQRPNGVIDRAVSVVSSTALAVPPFALGVLLVILFAVNRSWLPSGGYVGPSTDPVEWLRHIALPAIALAVAPAAEIARQTRGAFVDVLEQDFIRTARAGGLPRGRVLVKHALKPAAVPIVTVLGLQVTRVIGGAVVVERVFSLPGFGSTAVEAVGTKDFPLLQGVVLVSGVIFIVVNLCVDLSYGYLNPRSRE